ncbi:MAG TPA: hypothetical protein DCL21_01675 [Alphaproteobacteria bacterium]|nr:hypothetical protein [Alphaproteobacteria bacterium]
MNNKIVIFGGVESLAKFRNLHGISSANIRVIPIKETQFVTQKQDKQEALFVKYGILKKPEEKAVSALRDRSDIENDFLEICADGDVKHAWVDPSFGHKSLSMLRDITNSQMVSFGHFFDSNTKSKKFKNICRSLTQIFTEKTPEQVAPEKNLPVVYQPNCSFLETAAA